MDFLACVSRVEKGRKENACGLNIKGKFSRINFRQKLFEREKKTSERAWREGRKECCCGQ